MSQFSETPAVYEEVPYSAELADDIAAALSEEYGNPDQPDEEPTPGGASPDGENYPDEDFPEEEEDGEEEEAREQEEPEESDEDGDEEESEEEDDDEESEEESEEDEADKEVQGVVESLQKQADACATFLAAKGIDYNALRDEYLADGKLSKANLKALADAGIDEELINGYIEGQQARFETYSQHVMAIAGGAEEYDKLCKWAKKHLSEKEIKHFDKAVDSNDVDEARFAVKGLIGGFGTYGMGMALAALYAHGLEYDRLNERVRTAAGVAREAVSRGNDLVNQVRSGASQAQGSAEVI